MRGVAGFCSGRDVDLELAVACVLDLDLDGHVSGNEFFERFEESHVFSLNESEGRMASSLSWLRLLPWRFTSA